MNSIKKCDGYAERYYRAVAIAQFLTEGHTLEETKLEFRVSKNTIQRDLHFLSTCGYGKDLKRNFSLYAKAQKQLYCNVHN